VRVLRASPRRSAVLWTLLALVPVALLAATSIVLASNQVTSVVNKQVSTTAGVSAAVIGRQTTDLVELVHSYATRPTLIAGVEAGARGSVAVQHDLASLAGAVPGISATFITDIHGTSRNTYPPEPTIYGTNFAYRDWFKGLVATGRPFVSNAIVTKEASHALAVTITDYVRAPDGRPIGVLGANYSLQSIGAFAASVGRAQGITLEVTDRAGTSLTAGGAHGLVSVAGDPRVRAALAGHSGVRDYAPLLAGGHRGPKQLSAYAPIAGTHWTVLAWIPESVAFAGLVRLRNTVLAITALLVLMLLAAVRVMTRSDRRRRDSELALQRRDRELARVLESTDEGFLSIDRDGTITAWNARAEELYGWTAEEVIGRSLAETVIPAEGREGYAAELVAYRAGADSTVVGHRVEVRAVHRDGHEIPVEVGLWAHADGEGFSAFAHDITERVTMQAELETARDEAMQASRLKSEFLANMSHEIRTPMNGVVGMSGLLLKTELNVTQRAYAETVCLSAEALLTVINDILDFSKIEAGKLDVETISFDLRAVVEESAVLLAARAQQEGLELTCRIDPAIPPTLLGDPGRLRQVLLNLLGNAVKFTSEGEVNLVARLAGERPDGHATVELSVRDTGIGMSPPTLEHLFDAFTQAESSTARRYGGTGLGLAISRQLVELMGGALTVTSQSGAGSTFSAVIPFALGVAAASDGRADLVGVHALIVDDNTTNQLVLQEMVTAWGCTTAIADGAREAITLLHEGVVDDRPFDVVLLDLNMPGIDGFALGRMVSADPELAHTPMVMLTSSAQRGEAETSQQAGIVAYLTKPVRSAQLRGALDIALSARQSGTRSIPAATPDGAVKPNSASRNGFTGTHGFDKVAEPPSLTADAPVVLVVEDNSINQMVFTALLESVGYRSEVVENGRDALEALDLKDYAAVFMDCQMPVMDGFETTQELRRREGADQHTCVIAVTATAMASDRERCLDAGMDDYLTKPIDEHELVDKLNHWLTR